MTNGPLITLHYNIHDNATLIDDIKQDMMHAPSSMIITALYDQRGPRFVLASGRDLALVNRTSDFVKKFVSTTSLRSAKHCLNFSRKGSFRQIQMESNENDNVRGALIVLEGLDRSGKTSQCSRLHSYLVEQGIPVELWRFPDRNTCVGQMISSYLANKSQLDDQTVHLLFSANRWEKRSLMESKLKSGTTLIVDRYSYSGVAFSSAKGLDIEWCKAPEKGLLAPDLVLYLGISPEKAAERGGYGGERYEQLEFQRKVSQQYQILRDGTWKIIDACLPVEDVEKQLRELVLDCITTCRNGKFLSPLWLGKT